MEQPQQNQSEPINEQQAAAKAAILAECDNLLAGGITFVATHFDGYGDNGTTEEVKCYVGEWFASDEHEPVKYDASRLTDRPSLKAVNVPTALAAFPMSSAKAEIGDER